MRQAVLFGDWLHVTLGRPVEAGAADVAAGMAWSAARERLRAAGVEVLEERVVEPSLEDVFIDLVVRQDTG